MLSDEMENKKGTELAKVLTYYGLAPYSLQGSEKIVCPFHQDVNPSMIVDFDSGSWYCFGCGQHGDAVSFVKLLEKQINGLNDLNSYLKYLRILKSDEVKAITLKKNERKDSEDDKQSLIEAEDYYYCLRKVDWKKINKNDEEYEIKKYMNKRGFSSRTLNKIGAKYTFNKNYPIVFPMLDNGKFKGWVCRTTDELIGKKRKYLYNEGFKRSKTLFGNYGSKDYVFVVEGSMDRFKFIQFGCDNVVAILGWKMSDVQIKELKDSGVKFIISALDNDEYGRKGSKYLKKHFKVFRFKYLKGIKDPGDMNEENFDKMYKSTMKLFREWRKSNGIVR